MRIPSAEGFGQVIAEPARPDRRRDVTPDALGAGLARSIQGIAVDMAQEEQKEERARVQTQDAADRATAARAVYGARESSADAQAQFAEDIRAGVIPKDDAVNRWKQRYVEIRSEALQGVPVKYRADAEADIDIQSSRFTRGIHKAISQRDQADVREGINGTLEAAQRVSMRDPAAADKMVDDAIAQFGPHSGLGADELAKTKQAWRENTRFTRANALVLGARQDNKSLSEVERRLGSEEFGDMDPQRKIQLMTQIQGLKASNIQRAEAEAARARAAQDAALRKAESAFNAANSLVMGGKTLSPEYVTQLTQQTAGTPFAAALPDLLKQAPERSAFGMQPVAQMDATINQLRADLNVKGTDPRTEKRVNELEAIRDGKRKALNEDPLIGAQEYGGPPIPNIDTNSIGGLVASIAARGEAVTFASSQLGGQPVSPLTRQEAEQVGKLINVLPVEQRSSAVAQLAQVIGPQQSAALAKQMAPQDKALGLALGMAGDKTTAGRYTSELVLRGAQAIKDRGVQQDNKALTGTRALVAKEIGDAYVDQGVREAMIDAAVLAQYGLESEGSGDLPRAVRLVTGGLTEQAGKKIPLPRGMEPSEFSKRLKTLTVDSLRTALPEGKVYVSGTPMATDDFLKQVPNAALIHAGQGKYAVQTGAGLATNAHDDPVVFEVK